MNGKNDGFLRVRGRTIVDPRGNPVILRGMGLGGWLLPEGYMWKSHGHYDRPRRLERLVEELTGEAYARAFWSRYREAYISREDIALIASWGLNSVRIPVNARTLAAGEGSAMAFIPEAIATLDAAVDWCEEFGVYAIIDMHGAPGGQTGTNIDDSERDLPELYTDPAREESLIVLWRLLAARYADRPGIAAYDILNEPLAPQHLALSDRVMPLYERVVAAVREVDPRHIVILEGPHWATDMSVFDGMRETYPALCENAVLEFHKYWNTPDRESVQDYLDCGARLELPVFMGEGGENNADWYTGLFPMLEDNGISWNFWSYKKMDCLNSPISIPRPEGWNEIIEYAEGDNPRIPPERARLIFDGFLDALAFGSCAVNQSVISALLREPDLKIPAEYYISGNGGEGHSTSLTRSGGARIRVGDAACIRFADGREGVPDYRKYGGEAQAERDTLLVRMAAGDSLSYRVNVRVSGTYDIRAEGSGRARVAVSGETLGAVDFGGPAVRIALEPGAYAVRFVALSETAELRHWTISRAVD